MPENLLKHQRMRLARRLIGATGDIKVITPAAPGEHPIKTMTTLAGSHRQVITLLAKSLQRLIDIGKQLRRLSLKDQIALAVNSGKTLNIRQLAQVRIKHANRLS